MKKKTCSQCQITKPTSDFCKKSAAKDGFQPACKTCMNVAYTRSRLKKPEHYNTVKTARRHKCVELFTAWKATKTCELCPESDTTCLDLHHLDPNEKDVNIGDVSYSWAWDRLQTELDKCIVICANCHRKVHAGKITLLTKA